MKTKRLLALVVGCLLLCNYAMAELPTIDQVLTELEHMNGKVEVSDDLSSYAIQFVDDMDFGDFRIIILEREMPEKEFTAVDSGYPDHFMEGLPDDFIGKDIGKERVWVRCDLMNRLPEEVKAESLKDADLLLIGENDYLSGGYLSIMTYDENSNEQMPDFETVEEIDEYLATHQKKIIAVTYYPKFSCYTDVNLYNIKTKECVLIDYVYAPAKRFARNPEASDHWEDMNDLDGFISDLKAQEKSEEELSTIIDGFSFVPENRRTIWQACLKEKDVETCIVSAEMQYWMMAEQLPEIDLDERHRESYRLILDDKNKSILERYVEYCDYSGFDTAVSDIGEKKEYIAHPDKAWLEDAFDRVIDELGGN